MADPATTPPAEPTPEPVAPTPVVTELVLRILDLAIALTRATDAKDYGSSKLFQTLLMATCRQVPSHTDLHTLDGIASVRVTLNSDGAAYEISRSEGELISLKLFDLDDDAVVQLNPTQLETLRTDLARVLLGGVR